MTRDTTCYSIYTLPRKFKKDAPIHSFLARTYPDQFQASNRETTLFKVLTALRNYISFKLLYDGRNATVITCDPALEEVLNLNALHVTEVRDVVLPQLELDERYGALPDDYIPPVETARSSPAPRNQPAFNMNGKFRVKPKFLKVLRQVAVVDKSQTVFTYNEVTSYLSQYIVNNKDKFFDDRNVKVACVKHDILGVAFDVDFFHRTQVTTLLRGQLIHQVEAPIPSDFIRKPAAKPTVIPLPKAAMGSECTICCNPRQKTYAFVPCGHASFCNDCSSSIFARQGTCPICRTHINSMFRIFQ